MGNFLIFLIVASFLVERVCDRVLFFLSGKIKDNLKIFLSTIVGILISFGMRIGILGYFMTYTMEWMVTVDYILTGILIGEGSATMAKLLNLLSYEIKKKRMEARKLQEEKR